MNYERSGAATTLFNKTQIYAFYGTNSSGFNARTIECFDIYNNSWSIIPILNEIEGLQVTCGSACQINKDNIIIFGGFFESKNLKDNPIFNKKIIIFNANTNCINIYQKSLPIEFINSYGSQVIVYDNSVLALGKFLQEKGEYMKACLDTDYILKINSNQVNVNQILSTNNIT